LINFFSYSAISGSDTVRPSNLFKLPIVFLKLEISCVFAGSPMERCLRPKEIRDLQDGREQARLFLLKWKTYGVALLEVSLVMMSMPFRRATPI